MTVISISNLGVTLAKITGVAAKAAEYVERLTPAQVKAQIPDFEAIAEAKAEHALIERVLRIAHLRQLIEPYEVMLRAAELIRLQSVIRRGNGAVRPFELPR